LMVMRQLRLPMQAIEQQFRRMVAVAGLRHDLQFQPRGGVDG
jgi:hypothetical protein